jgi:hypothetical protein
MRENNPTSDQPGPTVPQEPPGAGTATAFDASHDTPFFAGGAPAGHAPAPSTGNGAGERPDERWRRRMLWLFVGLAVVLIGAAVAMTVRLLQTERALRNVARVAVMPPDSPGTALAGRPAALPPTTAGAIPYAGDGQQGAAVAASGNAAPAPEAVTGGRDVMPALPATGAQRQPPAQAQAEPAAAMRAATGAVGERAGTAADTGDKAGTVTNSDGNARERRRDAAAAREAARAGKKAAARAASRQETSRRGVAAKRAARGSDTFKRCPPLGKKGAVTCRWHVCNGGAGKEPVCRPYLERRP